MQVLFKLTDQTPPKDEHVVLSDYIPRIGELIEFPPFGKYLVTRIQNFILPGPAGLAYVLTETIVTCSSTAGGPVESTVNTVVEPWQDRFEEVLRKFEAVGYHIIQDSLPWNMLRLAADLSSGRKEITEGDVNKLREMVKETANIQLSMDDSIDKLLSPPITEKASHEP